MGSPREAVRIAETLVRSKLAACVNILPRVESRYRWKGRVEVARETLLLIKTNSGRIRNLCRRLKQLHSYEVPEILAVPFIWGDRSYLDWLQQCLTQAKTLDKIR